MTFREAHVGCVKEPREFWRRWSTARSFSKREIQPGRSRANSCATPGDTSDEVRAERGVERNFSPGDRGGQLSNRVRALLRQSDTREIRIGEPDAFPSGDLYLRSFAKESEAWRPWRAYAAMYIWNGSHPL